MGATLKVRGGNPPDLAPWDWPVPAEVGESDFTVFLSIMGCRLPLAITAMATSRISELTAHKKKVPARRAIRYVPQERTRRPAAGQAHPGISGSAYYTRPDNGSQAHTGAPRDAPKAAAAANKKARKACALRAGVPSILCEIGFLCYGHDSAPQTGIRHFALHKKSAVDAHGRAD